MQIPGLRAPSSSLGLGFITVLASASAAIGTFMAFRTLSTLFQLVLMLGWPTTPATLQSVELRTAPGANARSQSVVARYAYNFDGQSYTGSRVSLYAPDNLGTFHRDAYRELNDYLTRKAPYPLHVNPRAPGESILMPILRWEAIGFYLVLTVVFGGVGWTVLVTTLLAVRQRRAEAELVERYPDEPWKQRVVWAGPCIRSEQGATAVAAVCIAVLWNVASFPIVGVIVREIRSGQLFAIIFAVVPLVGVGLLYRAAVALARARRFHNTFLELDTVPVRPGETLRGRIQAPKALESVEQVSIRLECERRYQSRGRSKTTTRSEQLWYADTSTPVVRGQTPGGDVLLAFAIETPAAMPGSARGPGDEVLWLVSARAPLAGPDFEAVFEVPVFRRETTRPARTVAAPVATKPILNEKAPPREAWAMRWLLIGFLVLGLDYMLNAARNGGASFLERQLATRVIATGEVIVRGQADDLVQAAFNRARAAQPIEAGLKFVSADDESRRYQAWVTAPGRTEALAQLGTLLTRFQAEDGGEAGRDVQTISNAYVPPVASPELARVTRRISWGLLGVGLAALAAGARLFRKAPLAARARMKSMLVGDDEKATDSPSDDQE